MRGRSTRRSAAAFSLIEMITVLAIVGIVVGSVSIGLDGILRSSALSQAMGELSSDLALARQTAQVTNREHEVRFFRVADASLARSEATFSAYQVYVRDAEISPGAPLPPPAVALTKVRRLPLGVVFIDSTSESPLLTDPTREGSGQADPALGLPAEFSFVRFTPRGGTDLSTDQEWFITLADESVADSGEFSDFATLKIDPATGKIHWFRP